MNENEMPARHISTVTQNGMTKSQPGMSVSTTTVGGDNFSTLNVSRHYDYVPNEWGGHGVRWAADCDDIKFPTSDAANKFALERGYLMRWFARSYPSSALRAAKETVKRGGYTGKRKLTQYLVAKMSEFSDNRHIAYNITWSDLK